MAVLTFVVDRRAPLHNFLQFGAVEDLVLARRAPDFFGKCQRRTAVSIRHADQRCTRLCIERYRSQFEPSPRQSEPRAIAAVGVVCAESDVEAEHIGAVYRAMGRRIRLGIRAPLPTPEEAVQELAQGPAPGGFSEGEWPRVFIGSPEKVKAELEVMAEALGIDEIMAITITYDHGHRVRSYELLAAAFGLQPR